MQSVHRIGRKLGRAVLWEPTHDAYFRLAGMLRTSHDLPPLCITQTALRTVDARLREGDVPLSFGLLVGDRCVDSRTKSEYLLIDEVVSAHIEPFARSRTASLMHELRALSAMARHRGRLAIGWFVEEADVLDRMAPADVELHRAMFPAPWQVMLVRDLAGGRDHGGFIRIELSDQRPYAIPFFEVLSDTVLTRHRDLETVVRWRNYKTRDLVVLASDTDAERVASPPGAGVFRRLGDLGKRAVTPRTSVLPNGNSHRARVTERSPDGDAANTTAQPPTAQAAPKPEGVGSPGQASAPLTASSVVPVVTSIAVRPGTTRLPQRGTLQLQARALDATGAPVSGVAISYTSSDPSVVEVSATGLVTSIGPVGAASITVEGGNVSVLVRLIVMQVAARVEVSPSPTHLFERRRRRLTARVFDAAGAEMKGQPFDFSSSDEALVTVSSEGVLTPVGPTGEATITVSARGTTLSAQVHVTLVGATQTGAEDVP